MEEIERLEAAVRQKAGVDLLTIYSVKYVGNTNNWIARIVDTTLKDKQYYRIAEGIGQYVTFVSPRMPVVGSRFPGIKSSDPDPIVDSKIAEFTRYTFDSLQWLFEGRDG